MDREDAVRGGWKFFVPPDEALELVLEGVEPLEPVEVPREGSLGRVLAEDVVADRDYPAFRRGMMDGYAVRLADAGAKVEVVGVVAAGHVPDVEVRPGTGVEIMTGAPCPPGTEAVVPREDTTREGGLVSLPATIRPDDNIAPQGSEAREGQVVVPAGRVVTPLALANMAAFGKERVLVHRAPRAAMITTGDEVVATSGEVGPAQIRDSNGPMIVAMARQAGCSEVDTFHSGDTVEALVEALRNAAARADVVMLTGGVSAGRFDLVPNALLEIGATAVFHKVYQKPGRPLFFARRGRQLFFGLPGTPLGCHLGFHRYVWPVLQVMAGLPAARPGGEGTLAKPMREKGKRIKFRLVRVERSSDGWVIHPLPNEGSSDLYGPAQANAYVRIPDGEQHLPAGTRLPFEWTGVLR